MKSNKLPRAISCVAASVLFFTSMAFGQTQFKTGPTGDASFNAFLPKWELAVTRFVNGDPTLWKEICSKSNDASIFGAFGGYEKGWPDVNPRYDWAAAQFVESGSKLEVEYLNTVVAGELAYIIVIERTYPRTTNMEKAAPQILRATQIFRKESGDWKLLHRHADYLMNKKGPSSEKE